MWHSLLFQFFFTSLPNQNTCIYIHIPDCIETEYELLLLPNDTACETFLHKSGVMCSVDWIFITGAPAWKWLGEYVTAGKTFYNPRNKLRIQVYRWEPHKNGLPSTTAVATFFVTTLEWLALDLSAHTLSVLLCEWTVYTSWKTHVEGNNKCLEREVKILRRQIFTLLLIILLDFLDPEMQFFTLQNILNWCLSYIWLCPTVDV
jgi:hypothetical protein